MPLSTPASQTSVLSRANAGRHGALADMYRHNTLSAANSAAQRFERTTLTVGGSPSARDYVTEILGVTVTYTAPSSPSPTVANVAAGIAAAINSTPELIAFARASSAAAVVTINAQQPGVLLGVGDADADLTAAITIAAVGAGMLPFGRLCVLSPDPEGRAPFACRLLAAGDANATNSVFTLEASARLSGDSSSASFVANGVSYSASQTAGGAQNATQAATALAAALDALTGVTSTSAAAIITVTVAGSVTFQGLEGVFEPTITTAGRDAGLSGLRLALSVARHDEEVRDGLIGYRANDVAEVSDDCKMYLRGIAQNATVLYAGTSAGEEGRVYGASGAGRVLLPQAQIEQLFGDENDTAKIRFSA